MVENLLLPGLLLIEVLVKVNEVRMFEEGVLDPHILRYVPDEGEEQWQDGFKSATVAVLQQLQTAVYLPLLTTLCHLLLLPISGC